MGAQPSAELERLFGPDWPDVIDDLVDRPYVKMVYKEPVQIVGLSYRHDTMCLYIGIEEGVRKTIPLSDIDAVELP